MKKRKMMGLLATAMIFATVLTGCGGSASTSGEDKGTQASTQVETEAAQDVSSEAVAELKQTVLLLLQYSVILLSNFLVLSKWA